jgi:GT2 family glycosyltransferase
VIFIVIPVHNRREFTRQCLMSLKMQNSQDFISIVVDDGSTDGTDVMVQEQFPETLLLKGDGNLWWVGAVNKGINHVLSTCQIDDYVLLLNDDLIVKPNYISNLMKAAENHNGAIIGSVETTMEAPDIIRNGGVVVNWMTAKRKVLNQGRHLYEFKPSTTFKVSKLTGRGTLFPTEVFRKIGLFDDIHFKQCGDTVLPARANLKAGYELLISYDAYVISQPRDTQDINRKNTYSLSDFNEYFFGIKSHFNLADHYWFARNVSPNLAWFFRYLFFDILRTIGHFLLRFRF